MKSSFERLLVEGNAGKAKEVILEVIQIPGNGLAVETRAWIADFVVQIASRLNLKARQNGDDFAVGFDHWRGDGIAGTIGAEEFKERGVAQVFFKVGALAQILGKNLRDRQAMTAKMAGELEEGDILFAHRIENANGGMSRSGEADDDASRAAELALERLNALRRRLKVLFEKAFENFHEGPQG